MRGVTSWSLDISRPFEISTHTPHARRDTSYQLRSAAKKPFQLTRLMRGVTYKNKIFDEYYDISIHTPHARRDYMRAKTDIRKYISTHTPHARRDPEVQPDAPASNAFQLTRLMRGVTAAEQRTGSDTTFQLTRLMRGVTAEVQLDEKGRIISTHTPHARRDENPILFTSDQFISTHTPHARRDVFVRLAMACNC